MTLEQPTAASTGHNATQLGSDLNIFIKTL